MRKTVYKPEDVPVTGHYQLITFETVSVNTGYDNDYGDRTVPVVSVFTDLVELNSEVRNLVLRDSKAPFIVQRVAGRAEVQTHVSLEFKP